MPAFARPTRTSLTARSTRYGLAPLALGLLVAIGATVAGALPAALAAPGSNKVTICHRTHSVTNPYRMITVSASAADGAGKSDHTNHDEVYSVDGTSYPVFSRAVDYPANQKWWGDIIPPVRNSPGLNWAAAGAQEIYTGVGTSFGLCGRMSAKTFYDLEVAAGIPAADVLADLDEQASREDAELLQKLGVTKFSDLDPAALPTSFTSLPEAPKGAPAPASVTPEKGKQKIAVFVWYDTDRDGAFDADEQPASGIPVSLGAVVDVAPAGFGPATSFVMGAGQRMTDANGLIVDESITAGQWEAAAVTPEAAEVTYDSEGTVDDGAAVVDVPADSTGFAWIGLVTLAVDGPTDGGAGGGTDGGTDGGAGGGTDGGTDPGAGDGGPGANDESAGDGDAEAGSFDFADGTPVTGDLAATGGPLDAASLAVGAGALIVLGVALARRASSARRRSEPLLEGE